MTNSFIISQSFQSSQHSDINFRILAERCSERARELKRRIKGAVPTLSDDAKMEDSG